MNKLSLVALLMAAAAVTHVMADDAVPTFSHEAVGSPKTRAQVLAELQQARKDGTIHSSDTGYDSTAGFVSTKTRAEVMEELAQARAIGDNSAIHTDGGSATMWSAAKTAAMTQMARSAGR